MKKTGELMRARIEAGLPGSGGGESEDGSKAHELMKRTKSALDLIRERGMAANALRLNIRDEWASLLDVYIDDIGEIGKMLTEIATIPNGKRKKVRG